jgi:hypothetical protein
VRHDPGCLLIERGAGFGIQLKAKLIRAGTSLANFRVRLIRISSALAD